MYEDIVCTQPVTAGTTGWVSRYRGEPYYFCSMECRGRFEMAPEEYLPVEERTPVAAAELLRLIS